MSGTERPLSPHLQVYRWTITMASSILHRLTGVALAVGAVVLTLWLAAAAAASPDHFACINGLLSHWAGTIVLLAFVWSVFFHLFNGIRHLLWDAGYGYALHNARRSGWLVVIAATVLTGLAWAVACGLIALPVSGGAL